MLQCNTLNTPRLPIPTMLFFSFQRYSTNSTPTPYSRIHHVRLVHAKFCFSTRRFSIESRGYSSQDSLSLSLSPLLSLPLTHRNCRGRTTTLELPHVIERLWHCRPVLSKFLSLLATESLDRDTVRLSIVRMRDVHTQRFSVRFVIQWKRDDILGNCICWLMVEDRVERS